MYAVYIRKGGHVCSAIEWAKCTHWKMASFNEYFSRYMDDEDVEEVESDLDAARKLSPACNKQPMEDAISGVAV